MTRSLLLIALLAASGTTLAFDPVQATSEYLSSVSAAEEARTDAYVNTGYGIMVADLAINLVVALLLLGLGWSLRWRQWAERIFKRRFAQAFVYIPVYVVVTTALLFPLSYYADFHIEHRFGLSDQAFGAWLTEFLQSTALVTVGLSLFAGLLYWVIRATGQRWWAWGTGLLIAFMAILMLVSPLYIQPIFNEYRPMDEGPLKERILSLARANGMHTDDVKQVDQSRQTNRVSANVSGLFGTTRIALNDNLLNRARPEAVEAVMAHEIGHYVLNHAGKTLALYALVFTLCFGLTHVITGAVLRRKGADWGIRGMDDYAGFPLLYAAAALVIFLATPVFYRITYLLEVEADLFAINAVDNPDAWAEVALLTAEYRKLRPPEWEEKWLNHHPSPRARIEMAMRWKAENLPEGEQ